MPITLLTPIDGASFPSAPASIEFTLSDSEETFDVEIAITKVDPPDAWTYLDSGGPVDYSFFMYQPISDGTWYWRARYGNGSGVTATRTFTVGGVAPATKVVFVQQPSNAVAGISIAPAITVQLQDTANNNVAQAGVTISMALTTGTGVLSGTLSQVTNSSGLATFSNLSINLIGSKKLTASSTGLTSAVSNLFIISELIIADFTAAPLSFFESKPVQFTDLSTGSPTSWSWKKRPSDSNDAFVEFSTVQNPSQVFSLD